VRDISSHSSACTAIFTAVLIFVGGVSAYDGYLVVRTGNMIRDFEKNPVGRYLIDRNDGDPAGTSTAERITDRRWSSLILCKVATRDARSSRRMPASAAIGTGRNVVRRFSFPPSL
jgi:hypothetical protein